MKLLYCPQCATLIQLGRTLQTCECGKVKGRYKDHRYAVTNGEGLAIGIANGDFESAEHYTKKGKSIAIRCWARPHDGPSNDHSIIDKEL